MAFCSNELSISESEDIFRYLIGRHYTTAVPQQNDGFKSQCEDNAANWRSQRLESVCRILCDTKLCGIVAANMSFHGAECTRMVLNKKQKKQIDALKNKMQKAQQLLTAARNQPDDPTDVPRLEKEVVGYQTEIEKIKSA